MLFIGGKIAGMRCSVAGIRNRPALRFSVGQPDAQAVPVLAPAQAT